jgi:hypothetical protein
MNSELAEGCRQPLVNLPNASEIQVWQKKKKKKTLSLAAECFFPYD